MRLCCRVLLPWVLSIALVLCFRYGLLITNPGLIKVIPYLGGYPTAVGTGGWRSREGSVAFAPRKHSPEDVAFFFFGSRFLAVEKCPFLEKKNKIRKRKG